MTTAAARTKLVSEKHHYKSTRMPWVSLVVVVVIASGYCLIFAGDRSPIFVLCSWVLMILCAFFVLIEQSQDALAPAKVVSLLYTVSFSMAPLWLADIGAYRHRYFGFDVEGLMGRTSVVTLLGYISFLLGYFLYTRLFKKLTSRPYSLSNRHRRYLWLCCFLFIVIGGLFYGILVIRSGGVARLLGYIGGRADIFGDVYGGWFWGMHLLFAAYGLFCILLVQKRPWLCLAIAVFLSAAFVPLQGRDIVIAPIFCWLVFYHSLRKKLNWTVIGAGAFSILLLASLLGAFRGGTIRDDAGKFLTSYLDRSGAYIVKTVGANIEQFDIVMTAVRYVEQEHQTIGPMVLFSWIEPVDRALLGNNVPSIYSGVFIDLLLFPEHKGWNTAASPSLPGELFIGMSWFGILGGMLIYGMCFGQLTRWYNRRYLLPVLYAAFPFVVYMLAKMVVDGTAHLFRPLIVLIALYIAELFSPSLTLMTKRIQKEPK